jgi:hypothetical protein
MLYDPKWEIAVKRITAKGASPREVVLEIGGLWLAWAILHLALPHVDAAKIL